MLCFLALAVCVSMVGFVAVRVGVWGIILTEIHRWVIVGLVLIVLLGLTAVSIRFVYTLSKKVGFRYPTLSAACCGILTSLLALTGILWALSVLPTSIHF